MTVVRRSPVIRKLPRSFYDRDTIVVAHELLGKYLVHESRGVKRIGKIVEVEAYLGPHDLAAHSARGLTERTKVIFIAIPPSLHILAVGSAARFDGKGSTRQ
jgi:3-methyladenine DNA glycosylase Mpg